MTEAAIPIVIQEPERLSLEGLPDLVRELLDVKKDRDSVRKRLSFTAHKRISNPNLTHDVFPLFVRERFKIREMLGSGAYAQVWRVIDRDTDEEWAMKAIFKKRAFSQKRLDQEIEALKKANHPNIVCLKEILSDENHLFLRQDLAKGGCLFDWLIDSGGFTEEISAIITKQLLEAVAYLHRIGIVHRDIKLENILLGQKEDPKTVKLSDFGVVRILEERDKDLTHPGSSRGTRFRPVMNSHVGSIAYMAPEFFSGNKYDQSVDIWACGVLLYMMLSLRSPFGNEDNDELDQPDQIKRIMAGEYHFLFKIWSTRSEEAKDLIGQLLKVNPMERLTAEDALQHPWLKKFGL